MKVMMIDHVCEEIQQFQSLLLEEQWNYGLEIYHFKTPYEALTSILKELPDLVFLDIKTNDYDGLSIARQIKHQAPQIHIVFTTIDDRYAIEAFEVGAIDYLLPPFTKKRIERTLQRITVQRTLPQQYDPTFCCFGHLALQGSDGQLVEKIRWRTKKAQELFAYLLMNHGTELRKDFLVDLFWPHLDWGQGMNALYTTIYQIRKTLTKLEVNLFIDGGENMYICRLNDVYYGPERWERAVAQIEDVTEENIIKCIHSIYLYKGDFLGIYHYPWAEVERLRLRAIWLKLVDDVATYLWRKKQYEDVVKIYHYVQMICPEDQNSYFSLMKIYALLENREAVIANYKALVEMSHVQYDDEPIGDVQAWYEDWRQQYATKIG